MIRTRANVDGSGSHDPDQLDRSSMQWSFDTREIYHRKTSGSLVRRSMRGGDLTRRSWKMTSVYWTRADHLILYNLMTNMKQSYFTHSDTTTGGDETA